MKVRQLEVATAELREALSWYRERSPRAAENLWLRVRDARRSILLFPYAAPLVGQRVSASYFPGFPTMLSMPYCKKKLSSWPMHTIAAVRVIGKSV